MATPARLIAFGDIHGCDAALAAVLEAIKPVQNDQLVFLGDYIDRGPDSCQVIDRLIKLKQNFDVVTILGNHEEMMLGALEGKSPMGWWTMHGGAETLDSYGYNDDGDFSIVPEKHLAFINDCLNIYVTDSFFFTHGNYVANESLDQQPAEALRWESFHQRMPEPHASGRTAVVGHTSQKDGDIFDAGYFKCIDTFCHGGGWLTAFDVLSGEVWQADRTGRLREE